MDTLKFELSLLNQPVGKTIAEHVIKKNNINYQKYYPEKAQKYTEKDFRYSEKLNRVESPKKNEIDPKKLNTHLIMKAVDR